MEMTTHGIQNHPRNHVNCRKQYDNYLISNAIIWEPCSWNDETDACRVGGLRVTKNVSMKIPSLFDIHAEYNNQEGCIRKIFAYGAIANALSDCNGWAGEIEIMKSYIRYSFVFMFPYFKKLP